MDNFGTVNPDDFDRNNQREMDRSLLVKFFYKPMQDKIATKTEGRPIFKDTLYVDIRTVGDRENVCRPASQRDIDRFRDHYTAFINRTSGPEEEGTPLIEWPAISRAQVEEMAYFNVKTVEQLANISDANAQKFAGINMLRTKAQAWLEKSKENTAKAEIAEYKARVAALEAQLLSMNQKINDIVPEAPAKPKARVGKVKAKVNGAVSDASDSAIHS